MGVERAVVRWYAQRQLLLETLAALDEKLKSYSASPSSAEEEAALKAQWAEAQEKLRLLGPCPTPMMG